MSEHVKDLYCEEGLGCCLDDDSISSEEEGFMRGYLAGLDEKA